MFSVRTAKGRLAAAAVTLLATSVGACIQQTESPDPEPAPAATNEDTGDGDPDTGGQDGADDVEADAEATADGAAGIESVLYADCHEYNTAGGASDGVLQIFFGEVEVTVPVEVDVTFEDGRTETFSTEVGSDGFATVLIPLSRFGEVIQVTEIRFDDVATDATAEGGYPLTYTVAPESDCSAHPENG